MNSFSTQMMAKTQNVNNIHFLDVNININAIAINFLHCKFQNSKIYATGGDSSSLSFMNVTWTGNIKMLTSSYKKVEFYKCISYQQQ